uniref:Uncharacterized protein n=1 Tax=Meloidogyne javanica TaxID=6303 RepID=A0A915LWJ3_MELJA
MRKSIQKFWTSCDSKEGICADDAEFQKCDKMFIEFDKENFKMLVSTEENNQNKTDDKLKINEENFMGEEDSGIKTSTIILIIIGVTIVTFFKHKCPVDKFLFVKMNKRPHTSTDNLGNDSSPTNPPYSKKQLLLKTITELDFTGFVDAPPSDPNLPEYARTMIINQQKMLKQLNGLLRVASELLTEQKNFDDSFEQRQREHLLVITGLPESNEQQPMDRAASDNRNVRQILNELNIDRCLPSAVFRLGKQREPGSKPRPIKVQFPCTAAVVEALRNKKKLIAENPEDLKLYKEFEGSCDVEMVEGNIKIWYQKNSATTEEGCSIDLVTKNIGQLSLKFGIWHKSGLTECLGDTGKIVKSQTENHTAAANNMLPFSFSLKKEEFDNLKKEPNYGINDYCENLIVCQMTDSKCLKVADYSVAWARTKDYDKENFKMLVSTEENNEGKTDDNLKIKEENSMGEEDSGIKTSTIILTIIGNNEMKAEKARDKSREFSTNISIGNSKSKRSLPSFGSSRSKYGRGSVGEKEKKITLNSNREIISSSSSSVSKKV